MFMALQVDRMAGSVGATCFRRWIGRLRITFRSYKLTKYLDKRGAINISSLRDCASDIGLGQT
jgi:hypothetical protein